MKPQQSGERTAIYARFSSEMQSPKSSGDQERECRAFAERQGWPVDIVERDDAVRAGAVAGRVGFERLRQAAQAKKFDTLLVEEMSRFTRDFLAGFEMLAEFKKYGVKLADTKNGLLDLDSQVGQFQAFMGLSFGSQETKRLGERSKRGLKGKVLQKFSGGGRPPYGYARQPVFSTTQVDVDGRPKGPRTNKWRGYPISLGPSNGQGDQIRDRQDSAIVIYALGGRRGAYP